MTNHMHVKEFIPKGYEGTIKLGDTEYTIVEIATQKELPPVFARFNDWFVTTQGIFCISMGYKIHKSQLNQHYWFEHMKEKNWVKMGDFTMAYDSLLKLIELEIIEN